MRAAIEAEFDAKVVERQFGPQFNGPWDETGDGGDFDPAFLRMGAEGPLDVRYFEGEEEEDER
jgi:hypothetical protein